MQNNYHIPKRFSDTVAVHLIMNIMDVPNLRPPLILGIHGPAGEGKTAQCQWVFQEMSVNAEWIFSDEFGNQSEGVPAKDIKEKYKKASLLNSEIKSISANIGKSEKQKFNILFINDIDLRIGRSDNLIQQTVNTQFINSALMEIADTPSQIDGIKGSRVPIIITANNLSTLYSPLKRDGRMEKFEWIPTQDEKIAMIRQIFPEKSISDNDIRKLIDEFSPIHSHNESKIDIELSVSSFVTIRYRMFKNEIIRMIDKVGLSFIIDYVISKKHSLNEYYPEITYNSLQNTAREIITDNLTIDHLRK